LREQFVNVRKWVGVFQACHVQVVVIDTYPLLVVFQFNKHSIGEPSRILEFWNELRNCLRRCWVIE